MCLVGFFYTLKVSRSVAAAAEAGEGFAEVESVVMLAAVAAQAGGHGRLANLGRRRLQGMRAGRAMA